MRLTVAFSTLAFALSSHATAEPFEVPPETYAETVNAALQQVGTDLRVRRTSCVTSTRCRFAARQVAIEVAGPADRSATERITIMAKFQRGDDESAKGLIEDTLTVLGATMVAYDPGMAADRRAQLLLELGDAALSVGEAHRDGSDMHYALSFDDVSGRLEIIAATLRTGHG